MEPLDPRTIAPGYVLPKALFTSHGAKLLSARVELTADMCELIRGAHRGHLFVADSVDDLRRANVLVEAEQGDAGTTASVELATAGGVVVTEAGQEIDQLASEAYGLGAYTGGDPKEARRSRAQRLKFADRSVAERSFKWERISMRIEASRFPIQLSARDEAGWPDEGRLTSFRQERVDRFRPLFVRVVAGVRTDAGEALAFVEDMIDKLQRFPSRFTQLALLAPRRAEYLPDHCYTTAVLSVAIAARLEWSPDDVRLAGLAGLLCDVGMGLVPPGIRSSNRPLDDAETNRILRHPTQSVVLLDSMNGLPEAVKMAAYQHHERDNGCGYPNYLKWGKIGDLARVVAVADAFAAATEPRSFRAIKRPYDALEDLIMLGSQGMYDRRAVRALAKSTGLFPVGSYVRLSSGDMAQVMACRSTQIDRPTVRVLPGQPSGAKPNELIDLTELDPWELSVIQAAEEPETLFTRRAAAA